MNDDFKKLAMQDAISYSRDVPIPAKKKYTSSTEDMQSVLGHTPQNRRDRRKAEKLLRKQIVK